MFLLAASSLLLFFITYSLGKGMVVLLGKWLSFDMYPDFLGVFFIGLVGSFIYFNIASFWVPANYKLLLPLLLYAIFYFSKKANRYTLYKGFTNTLSFLSNPQNGPFTFCFGVVLFLFWLIPPGNWDSGDYHYLSIRWYEDYAVVPGLANVHGRLAFNPANFIVSAAYSFTNMVGQPLYPLNGVIEALFFTWLLRLAFQQTSPLAKTIFLIYAIMRARDTLINITSPSSDMLVMTLLSYCAVHAYFCFVAKESRLHTTWLLVLLTAFGPCAKLSALPTLLLVPLLWFGSSGPKTTALYFKTALVLLLLWLPWLVRNAVMSGYLLYPVNHTNLIPLDWTIPKDVFLLEDFQTRYSSRGFHEHAVLATMNLRQLIAIWLQQSLRYSLYPFAIAVAAFALTPVALFFIQRKKQLPLRVGLLCGVYYVAAIIWLVYSPEFRFGITLLQLLLLFVFLQTEKYFSVPAFWLHTLRIALVLFMVAHFSFDFVTRPTNRYLRFSKHWFFPPQDYRLLVDDNNKKTFPYVLLQPGVPLYFSDSTHHCMNACLPCMSWHYGQIELRGNTLQQGFRNVKCEVRKYYPWLPK